MRPLVILKMLPHLLAPLILCSNNCGRHLLFLSKILFSLDSNNTKISKFFSYLLHMGIQATNKNIFFYFLQWNWNGNLTKIVLLTSLLRLFLINAVVISKPVVVIIFLLAFFIIFLLQMVHNLGFLASFLISNYRNITPSSFKNKISIGFLFANG